MNAKKILSIAMIGLLSASVLAISSFAAPGQGAKMGGGTAMTEEQREERRDLHLERMAAVLNLTEEQKTQIEALRNQKWENTAAQQDKMAELREELREMGFNGSYDETRARALANELAAIKADMMVENIRLRSEIHSLLTPEQQELVEKLRPMKQNCKGQGFKNKGRCLDMMMD
jgi:protein CpxP